MIFRPFYYDDKGCASYLLGCGTLGRCAVVDPRADDVDAYAAFAHQKNMRITHVVDTHVHADHRSGGVALASAASAQYCLHEAADVSVPFAPLRDRDEIELGNTRVRVLHTPGHSPDSICLLVTDLKRGTDPWFVLTGDTLFSGGVGRPDLLGEGAEVAQAEQLYDSLHGGLLRLPDHIEVFPAHFGGAACGKGLSGKPGSTIGFERRFNPALQRGSKADFVEFVLEGLPPQPEAFAENRRRNLGLE
jgi:glyoxylase-like metal-dependent hydrolase (beta-lactamase superfamily II)